MKPFDPNKKVTFNHVFTASIPDVGVWIEAAARLMRLMARGQGAAGNLEQSQMLDDLAAERPTQPAFQQFLEKVAREGWQKVMEEERPGS